MKRRLLFAMLCIVSALGMRAQTWTAPTIQGEDPVGGTQYKVMNVETGMFLDMGKAWFGWATTAILSNTGIDFTMTADGTNWKFIRTGTQGVFTSGNGINGDAMHVDNTAQTYGITKLANGYYHIHDAGGDATSLCWGNDGTTVGVVAHADATAAGWMCNWVFIQPANVENVANVYNARLALYNEYLKAYAEGASTNAAATVYNNSNATVTEINNAITALHQTRYEHALDVASNDDPRDITEWVLTNADFSAGNINGWETNYVSGQQAQNIGYQGATYTNGSVIISQFIEAWRPGATLGDGYLRQTVSGLPEGKFVLSADAIATWQNDDSRVITGAQLYITADGVTYKTDMSTKNGAPKHFTTEFMNTGEGDVIFGLRTVSATCNWMCADNFKVTFYGIDLSPYAALLAQAVAEAEALQGTIPNAVYNALKAVVTENNKEYDSSKDYTTAIAAIQQATDNAKAIQANFAHYQSIKDEALAVAPETETDEADAAANDAIDAAGVNAAIATLRAAFLAELPKVTVPEGGLDVTAVMVENASVRQNVEGWNIDNLGRPSEWSTGPTTNYEETEFYQSTFDFNQTLTLTPGTWEFGVTGFHRGDQGDYQTYFYAGEDRTLLPGEASNVVNSMADAKTYFDNGNGKVALKFLLEGETNTIKIGIINDDTGTDRWTIFRDFTLKYYGAPDYSLYENQWAALVIEANTAKSNHVNVTGTELTDLGAAIADSPAGSNLKATYIAKINALQEALEAFNAAAPAYDKYVAYKAETEDLWGTDFDVPTPTTAAEATTAVQNLNIAQYNKVATDYPFSLTSKIGDFSTWTGTAEVGTPRVAGTPNSLNWEHWSGTTHPYYEQDNSGYSNEGGWTIQYTKTTTLPAGSYVVKVAARSSAGVTSKVTCSALADVEISLPCAGNNTRGINTRGEASWSNEDTFIKTGGLNNDPVSDVGYSGAGWQWRFLPFTLETETEVTMTFYAEASTKNQWMSIADGELLSAENVATSVEYNDEETSDIEDVDVANVTITRKVKEGLNTVVLPFDLTLGQMEAAFGTGAEVYAYTETGDNPKDVTINFNKVAAGTISANVPVLVKATKASTEQVFEGVQVVAPTADVKVAGTNFDYVGVYAPMTVATGDYFVSDGKLFKSVGSTNLKGFRAYLKDKNPDTTGEVKLYIDGVATAISEINADVQESGVIYNLAGQRVSKTTRGIYVKNGRKVVVK